MQQRSPSPAVADLSFVRQLAHKKFQIDKTTKPNEGDKDEDDKKEHRILPRPLG
jgi:hypothetical protein